MTTRIYDSNRVQVSFAGVPVQGYADGEFLTIAMNEDAFTSVVGTDGEVSRSKTNNNTATIEIKLLQTSPTNALLSSIHNADKLTNGGSGVGAFLVADLNGATQFSAGNAWIMKAPDASYDREATERVWTLECDVLIGFEGGNI